MATPGKPLSESDQNRILKLRGNGLSIRQIASQESVSKRTVEKYLKRQIAK